MTDETPLNAEAPLTAEAAPDDRPDDRPDVGLIGGSGLYSLLEEAEEVVVDTPFGAPTAPITVGVVGSRRVAFLPRHGVHHEFPPHRINYRANLWALRAVGVRQVLAPCAVGSLRPDLTPGTFVIPDQVVDRTSGRPGTYFDEGAVHVPFSDPYCPDGRATALRVAEEDGAEEDGAEEDGPEEDGAEESGAATVVDGGTMVVIEGPRFSSRAESEWYAGQGWALVNMTGQPEATLARELAMCYTAVALVTDLDAGIDAAEAVTQAEVFAVFQSRLGVLRRLLLGMAARLPAVRTCACTRAHDGITLPFRLP